MENGSGCGPPPVTSRPLCSRGPVRHSIRDWSWQAEVVGEIYLDELFGGKIWKVEEMWENFLFLNVFLKFQGGGGGEAVAESTYQ